MLHNCATCLFEVFADFSEWCNDFSGKFGDSDRCHKGNPEKYESNTLDDNVSKYPDKIFRPINAFSKTSVEVDFDATKGNRGNSGLYWLSVGVCFFLGLHPL